MTELEPPGSRPTSEELNRWGLILVGIGVAGLLITCWLNFG